LRGFWLPENIDGLADYQISAHRSCGRRRVGGRQAQRQAWGFIAALPLVTFLALIWLYIEKQPLSKISNHAWYTFWYVVPTLPMFLAFPMLLPRFGFWLTLLASVGITVVCFGLFALLVRQFGIQLLP
jgi:hypothetical protein